MKNKQKNKLKIKLVLEFKLQFKPLVYSYIPQACPSPRATRCAGAGCERTTEIGPVAGH